MIINNKYNFLFIHIQKTAGTSVTNSLNKIEETKQLYYPHSMINILNVRNYQNYFKFCFVRNPFDRLLSWYNMIINKGVHNDWSDYLLKNSDNFSEFLNLTEIIIEKNPLESMYEIEYPKSISFNQLDYISDNNGNILVDFIGRFEIINEDYNKIMEKINVKDLPLPHLNKFDHKDYRNYYTDKDVEKVYEMYKRDIEYFGYEF